MRKGEEGEEGEEEGLYLDADRFILMFEISGNVGNDDGGEEVPVFKVGE